MSTRTTVTFDGHDLTADYVASNLRESLLPRALGTVKVPGRDGTLYTGSTLSQRSITMTLTARSGTPAGRQAAARALAAKLAVREPRPLAISHDGGLYWLAVPISPSTPKRYLHATSFDVEFVTCDPVMYGEHRSVTVPSGGSLSFTVNGSYPTMPNIAANATPSGGVWKLQLEDGSFMAVALPGTRAVVCNCAERVLTVAGDVWPIADDADWLVLAPGQHTLSMTGTGAATVEWDERWL